MAAMAVGVLVGRFHVPKLHPGHVALYNAVKERSDQVVVLLGVSRLDGYVAENPLSFNQRKALFPETTVVLPVFDEQSDEAWSGQIDAVLRETYPCETLTLFGGRDSFIEAYSGKLRVERLVLQPAVTSEGTLHRAAIKQELDPAFMRGQIYSLQRQFPHAYQTVDIALTRHPDIHVLIIRRADTGEWCFPGGFVDPNDVSLEAAAGRELHEEIGIYSASKMEYVTSMRMDDWRYRGSRDKIVTALFVGWHTHGTPAMNPEEVQDYKWVSAKKLPEELGPTHQPLVPALIQRLRP